MKRGKLITRAWKQMSHTVMPCATCSGCLCICRCSLWMASSLSSDESSQIPRDVPKGHLVVYVGKDENYTRFVVKLTLLKHPLFRALLDKAREDVYDDFTAGSKLCIPCDESIFLEVVRCAGNSRSWRLPIGESLI